MKRSDLLSLVERAIRNENTSHYSYDSKRHADKVLKIVETSMIPNWVWKKPKGYKSVGCLCTMRESCENCIPEGFTMLRKDWEPEDE